MSDELLPEPPFVVLRAARGVPPGWMPAELEGRWYNRSDFRDHDRLLLGPLALELRHAPHAVVIPTDRVEHRDDGASAQVLELHPSDGNYANDGDPAYLA